MIIIPAIDLKNSKCVRLTQGKEDNVKIYNENPIEQARLWESKEAEIIHIVDLDGAFQGVPKNFELIKNISNSVKCELEIGGGIRDIKTIELYSDIGFNRIIIGTQAYKDRNFIKEACKLFPNKIIVGIDAFNDKVAINGWKTITDTDYIDFANELEDYGVSEFILTSISQDGMMQGIDKNYFINALEKINSPIILSGGVSTLDDVRFIKGLERDGLKGMIIGKALYELAFTFEEAQKIVKKN